MNSEQTNGVEATDSQIPEPVAKAIAEHREAVQLELLERERRFPQAVISCVQNWRRGGAYRKASVSALAWTVLGRATTTSVISAVGIAGVLGIILAWQANALLQSQNERLDVQTHLAEAQRRAALIFELTSILDQLRDERSKASSKDRERLFNPSAELGARIVALSRSLRPYYFVTYPTGGGSAEEAKSPLPSDFWARVMTFQFMGPNSPVLGTRPLSPERAQLLMSLAASRVDLGASSLQGGTLANSDLSGTLLRDISLSGVDLQGASLRGSRLMFVRFSEPQIQSPARLDDADFTCADFTDVFLISATLDRAKFAHVEMRGFDFVGSKRPGYGDFSVPSLDTVHLGRADLTNADFQDVILGPDLLWFDPDFRGELPKGFERERWQVVKHPSRPNHWLVNDTRDRSNVKSLRDRACK